ncbi:MAG: hypothetical protein ACRER3_25780, partial [Pseudomonas fluorescens]
MIGKRRLHRFDEVPWQAESHRAEGYINDIGSPEGLNAQCMGGAIGPHFVVFQDQCRHFAAQVRQLPVGEIIL